jgi:hypothetical protein
LSARGGRPSRQLQSRPGKALALAGAVFEGAIEEKPDGRFMIRSRTRVVKRQRESD